MKRNLEADIIKIAVVITAIPRWTGALLEAEGVPLPDDWRVTWRVAVAVLSIGMAVAEAFAISYMLNAWRVQHDKGARWLLVFALATIVIFCAVLAPYVAANVHRLALGEVLGTGWLWWAWSIAVPASTGITVWGVGYAQKRREAVGEGYVPIKSSIEPIIEPAQQYECQHECQHCQRTFRTIQALNAHRRFCAGNHASTDGKDLTEQVIHDKM